MAFESTLPGRYFYDPAIFAREQERIFSRMSTVVCDWLFHPADLARPDVDADDTVNVFAVVNRQD